MKPLSAIDVAKYFIELAKDKGETVSIFKMHYLLFYAQRKHIYSKLKPLFREPIIRWFNTVMIPEVNKSFTDLSIQHKEKDLINKKTKLFLQKVYDKYAKIDFQKLEQLIMKLPEVERLIVTEEVGFDVLVGNKKKLVKSYSNSDNFNQVYSQILPIISKFKVKRFVVRRFWTKTLEIMLMSEEFNEGSVRDNVKALVDFSLYYCPALHTRWLVTFRPKGIKKQLSMGNKFDKIKIC